MFQTKEARLEYYEKVGVPSQYVRDLEAMRVGSPARDVKKGSLVSTVIHYYSKNMGRHLVGESLSVEGLFLYEQELLLRPHEVYTQVQLRGVRRTTASGKLNAANIVCDAMLFSKESIRLIECKARGDACKLVDERPHDWEERDGVFHRPQIESWAAERGWSYEIWTPPDPFALYLQNLQALDAARHIAPIRESRLDRRILQIVEKRPETLANLVEALGEHGHSHLYVYRMILDGKIFGTLKAGSFSNPETFILCESPEQRDVIETELSRQQKGATAAIKIDDPVLTATTVDLRHGRRRLERVNRMIDGEEIATRHYQPLIKKVLEAREEGKSELEACLTSYNNSGHRAGESRLTKSQGDLLEDAFVEFWDTGEVDRLVDLYEKVRTAAEKAGISEIPSNETVRRRVRLRDPSKHDLAVGGKRNFHKNRKATDPKNRTLPASLPFVVAHVDATLLDNRSIVDNGIDILLERPCLYSAICQATGSSVGHSLRIGTESRYAFFQLMRAIVRRFGRLPLVIFLDAGSVHLSNDVLLFAERHEITIMRRPASAPKFGSEVESQLKSVNYDFAHRLPGSTKPDTKERAADNSKKSYATARLAFETIKNGVEQFFSDIWPSRPIGSLGEPPQVLLQTFPEELRVPPVAVSDMDRFRLLTSPSIEPDRSFARDSIRYRYREYRSDDLYRHLQFSKPDEIRIDCENAAICYAKFSTTWITAYTGDVTETGTESLNKRQFDIMSTAARAAWARDARNKSNAELERIIAEMKGSPAEQTAKDSQAHADSTSSAKEEESEAASSSRDRWAFDTGSVTRFETT